MSEQTPPPEQNPYGPGGSAGSPPPPTGEHPSPQGASSSPPPPPPTGDAGGYPQYTPGPESYGPPPTGPRPGELMDRFLARLIDYVLLLVVSLVINLALLAGVFGLQRGGSVGASLAYGVLSAVVTTVIYLGYFGFMESSRGQTLGKMAMKLHVRNEAGANPTMSEAIKRNIWMALPLLGIIPILGSFVAAILQLVAVIMIAVGINNDPVRRRPWTDKFADTYVVKEG